MANKKNTAKFRNSGIVFNNGILSTIKAIEMIKQTLLSLGLIFDENLRIYKELSGCKNIGIKFVLQDNSIMFWFNQSGELKTRYSMYAKDLTSYIENMVDENFDLYVKEYKRQSDLEVIHNRGYVHTQHLSISDMCAHVLFVIQKTQAYYNN